MHTPHSSSLLLSEPPLQVLPGLARAIGLNEAIVLQQVHYWILKNREKADHWHEERCWVYNTYEEWKAHNFPFWSVHGIRKIFRRLKLLGLILVGNFNKKGYDRTIWYSIDYERLGQIADSIEHTCPFVPHDAARRGRPIPETNYRDIPLKEPYVKDDADRFSKSIEDGWIVLRKPQSGLDNKEKRRKAGKPHHLDKPESARDGGSAYLS